MNAPGLPPGWGLRPVLFRVGSLAVPSYEFFMALALAVALAAFILAVERRKDLGDRSAYLAMAAMVGGALGAKLPGWVMHFREIAAAGPRSALFSGRTIVGGLIGATAAVALTRRLLGMRDRSGNLFAVGLALAVAIGRIGCLLRGCCYGVATTLPWAVDLGDGIRRHPTQAYEALFALALFAWLLRSSRRDPEPGALFRTFMLAYFSFRFLVEFVRFEPPFALGLTLAQVVSLGVLIYYLTLGRIRPQRAGIEVQCNETVQAR